MAEARALSPIPDSLLALLDAGELVVALSLASTRTLRRAFEQRQRARGLTAWEPARILAWPQWTSALFAELILSGHDESLLLNHTQELALWAGVIDADDESASLDLSSDAVADLAELAHSGFTLAADFNVLDRLRSSASSRDERIFARWVDTFRRGCTRRGYLPAAQLSAALADHARAGSLPRSPQLPPTLHLFDAHELTPAQHALLEALRSLGHTVEQHHPLPAEPTLRAWTTCASPQSELNFAARWLRSRLEPAAGPDSTVRIALVVPSLDAEQPALEPVLRNILAPELHSIAADLSSTPWSFPSGAPLATLPILRCVLDLARWTASYLPIAQVSELLLSPYLGHLAERDAAAVFDADILRSAPLLEPELSLHTLLELARRAGHRSAEHDPPRHARAVLPSWVAALHTALRQEPLLLDRQRPRSWAEWMEVIRAIAHAAGWPGDRALNAAEFAATRAFDSALDSLATLDATAGQQASRISFATALHALERQLRRSRQQPLASDAPLTLLAPHELDTALFDTIVFLRATDANWPATTRPHPLLSRTLQREAAMPGGNPDLAAGHSRRAMERLLERTPNVLFTCAREDANGHLRPSPLLQEFALQHVVEDDLLQPAAAPEPVPLEDHNDAMQLPALAAGVEVKGGSRVLKLQAACGFLAFAELRLSSASPETREAGLDPRQRGNLVHQVLEAFWREVQTRDALEAMSADERTAALEWCIDTELNKLQADLSGWSEAYLQVVRERTLRVLQHWLHHELERSPFTVLELEPKKQIAVGPLTLSVRMDRIERIGDDGIAYVDYKTGIAQPKAWDGERPEEPQLPLYALDADPTRLRALIFANVRAGKEAAWNGLQSEEGIIPSKRPKIADLEARSAAWRDVLTTLAEDFHAGRAYAAPKDAAINCAVCAQRLLCRRDAAALRDSILRDSASLNEEFALFDIDATEEESLG